MLRLLIFLGWGVFALSACGPKGLAKKYRGADSLVIRFYKSGTDEVDKEVVTTDKTALRKLLQYIDGSPADSSACGYSGDMAFYLQGQLVLPVVFQAARTDCRRFIYEENNRATTTNMSDEAASFLESVRSGRGWY
jgi:hypothetical protein